MATAPIKKRRSLIFRVCRALLVLVLLLLATDLFRLRAVFLGQSLSTIAPEPRAAHSAVGA